MVRHSVAKWLYGLAVLCMPLSYGVKQLLGLSVTWINPTLILAFMAFVLLGFPMHGKWESGLVVYAFVGALVGWWLMPTAFDRDHSALYTVLLEPIRLALNFVWFWMCVRMLRTNAGFVVRCVVASALIESAVAIVLYAALLGYLDLGSAPTVFLEIYKLRQTLWFGATPVYRMAGTYFESPPFGLFMFCCFVILLLTKTENQEVLRKVAVAVVFALLLASLADQVLVAAGVFGFVYLRNSDRISARLKVALVLALLVISIYTSVRVIRKYDHGVATSQGDVLGSSGAERMFHSQYAVGLLAENPAAVLFGIGLGRYGDYVVRTGMFPSSVGIQVAWMQWLVELGVVGLLLLVSWICSIAVSAWSTFRWTGVAAVLALLLAVLFQANWLWEPWFLALAVLACSTNIDSASLSTSTSVDRVCTVEGS